jgi:hypothetical protein
VFFPLKIAFPRVRWLLSAPLLSLLAGCALRAGGARPHPDEAVPTRLGQGSPVGPVVVVNRGTSVEVSRDEVRIQFGPEPDTNGWGWTEAEARGYVNYLWMIYVDGVERPLSLVHQVVVTDGRPRAFASLAELLAAGEPGVCGSGMIAECTKRQMRTDTAQGGVRVVLRDSALIAQTFGMRPEWVAVYTSRPGGAYQDRRDSVRVRYVDPQLPVPDSAATEASRAARRRYQASINSITRAITRAGEGSGRLWVAVGDSIPLHTSETSCTHDVCHIGWGVADSAWSVSDASIARLHLVDLSTAASRRIHRRNNSPRAYLLGLRPGRVVVRVQGMHGSSDTMPSREPPPREVQAQVHVTYPIARLQLRLSDSVTTADRPVRVRVRAIDVRGREVPGAAVELTSEGEGGSSLHEVAGSQEVLFYLTGVRTIRARFGGREATAVLRVVASREEE